MRNLTSVHPDSVTHVEAELSSKMAAGLTGRAPRGPPYQVQISTTPQPALVPPH